ncbi:MAG TPA: transposase [Coxiellaceae bacterium]|nr:transposase [Coxiellaceae bacterium]
MPRALRIHYENACYHVILRGNNYEDIFLSDNDQLLFCALLEKAIQKFNFKIHLFCLMTNHVHLLIQVSETPLSKIMQNISMRYTYWLNKKLARVGHVFQGRYKAILVEKDEYLLELCRYIHFNPVKAAITTRAEDYHWSSHNDYLGKRHFPWLTTIWILNYFHENSLIAEREYKIFMKAANPNFSPKEGSDPGSDP